METVGLSYLTSYKILIYLEYEYNLSLKDVKKHL